MIRSGMSSLVVTSIETEADTVTRLLGIAPTEVTRKGAARRSGRVRDHNTWSLEIETLGNTDDDQTGTRALRDILDRCRPACGRIRALPTDCEARIWWSGDSDSTQGGFVLAADLASQIAEFGVDVYATVYLEDDDRAEESGPG